MSKAPPPASQPPDDESHDDELPPPGGDDQSSSQESKPADSDPSLDTPSTWDAEPEQPGAGDDGFLDAAKAAHDADPDIFRPDISPQGGNADQRDPARSSDLEPPDPLLKANWRKLSSIAEQIGRSRPADMLRAAAEIRRLRHLAPRSAGLTRSLNELVAIWRLVRQEMERRAPAHVDLKVPYEATELLPHGSVIPSRPAQLGGRSDPLPTVDQARLWCDQILGTEDGIREFCCFALRESEPSAGTEPLVRLHGVEVCGSTLARMYRSGVPCRPWDPVPDPDAALLQDLIVVTAYLSAGPWTPDIARKSVPRLRPYLRTIPDELLLPSAAVATGVLEGRGLFECLGRTAWRLSPRGHKFYHTVLRPTWSRAPRHR